MRKLTESVKLVLFAALLIGGFVMFGTATAVTCGDNQVVTSKGKCISCPTGQVSDSQSQNCYTPISGGELPQAQPNQASLKKILSIVFGIIGALAFLMIVISGFRYVLSAGNADRAKRAREGVVYALVGLVIALSAWAIVGFVVTNL